MIVCLSFFLRKGHSTLGEYAESAENSALFMIAPLTAHIIDLCQCADTAHGGGRHVMVGFLQ
jgi:hypothetical protein